MFVQKYVFTVEDVAKLLYNLDCAYRKANTDVSLPPWEDAASPLRNACRSITRTCLKRNITEPSAYYAEWLKVADSLSWVVTCADPYEELPDERKLRYTLACVLLDSMSKHIFYVGEEDSNG